MFDDYVRNINGRAMADSRAVAQKITTRHGTLVEHFNIVRSVKRILSNDPEAIFNFEECLERRKSGGKPVTYYLMDRDGFMLLVMDLRGKVGAKLRRMYLNAFKAMEAFIQSGGAYRLELAQLDLSMASDHASIHGRGLSMWGREKRRHAQHVKALRDAAQLRLPFGGTP
jgi:Rha family phage regulatory protein